MEKRKKLRPLWILLSVMAGAAVVPVLLGSLGVLRSYRYDGTGFAVGGGTVAGAVREIAVDWLAGPVRVEISEDDRHLSVSEYASEELRERDRLRWRLDGDGKLTVMACASANILPQNPAAKVLVIRVPAALAGEIGSLSVHIRSGAGDLTLDVLPEKTAIRVDRRGEIRLTVPEEAGFTLCCEKLSAPPTGPEWTERDGAYVRLDGRAGLTVTGTGRQTLRVERKQSAE